MDEKITHAAGADTAEGRTVEKLTGLIKAAGKIPMQRDTLYNIIKTY